jgi:hypothetical protein
MGRALFLVFSVAYLSVFSQIGPRVWQDHLSLNSCISVAKLGSKIYGANSIGVVWFDESELSPQSLTKINGLNDVSPKLLRANPYNNKLLVLYESCNIDVIDQNEHITNYADFKLKLLNGKKSINEAVFRKQYAYLACGFGIVVFDTEKMEVKDTYIIGQGGADLEVYQVALNDSLIFAATPKGLYRSNYLTKDLSNFNNWKPTSGLPLGAYSGVVSAGGIIVAAYSANKADPSITLKDSLFRLRNNVWDRMDTGKYTVYKMFMASDTLFSFLDDNGLKIVNVKSNVPVNYITSFNGKEARIRDTYYGKDHVSNLAYWVADFNNGLYQTYSYWPFYEQFPVRRAGINRAFVNSIDIYNGKVGISPSRPDDGGGSLYTDEGVNVLDKGEWTYVKDKDTARHTDTRILDITGILFDRQDPTHMWVTSWFSGLLEYKNNKLQRIYNASNTPSIQEVNPANPRCIGMAMDGDGNLWFATSDVTSYINVRKKNGVFQHYDFGVGRFTRKLLVDKNNMVWALHEREGGITVLKHNNFGVPTSKLLTKDVNNGNIQSNSVYSIAEDKDGKIWIGTSAGVAVFYNPSSIFTSSSFDAQPIKIVQDGNVELLLSKEVVTAIAVDGANNKWMGTQSGGVYCFSPDGLQQIYHFTKDNSPLYSNFIMDINYDETTGDMYFGTDLGLQSYRSPILEGVEQYNGIVAYPNPVKPNYLGTVFVRGLIDNSIVKIADESGNIVWETKSHGGQVEWGLTSFSGNRVAPGVYLVYTTSTDAEQKAVTKILVIN